MIRPRESSSHDAPRELANVPSTPESRALEDELRESEKDADHAPFHTLRGGKAFVLCDSHGDILAGQHGYFVKDTRMLSRFELLVAEKKTSLLGAAVTHDNVIFMSHLTNRPLPPLGERSIPKGIIHLQRERLLYAERIYERLRLKNYGRFEAALPIRFRFAADFRDIFEVQGHHRAARGEFLPPEVIKNGVRLSYRGLDGVTRTSEIRFSVKPVRIDDREAEFRIDLAMGASADLWIEIGPPLSDLPSAQRFAAADKDATRRMAAKRAEGALAKSPSRLFNLWIEKSHADLVLLTSKLATGPYPLAGIPWFDTTFGRDGLITALQTLWLNPALSRGVLNYLASTQAQETSAFRDAEPGKILHEAREGEMAAMGEVPFRRYYGGVDATPLFVMLAGAYHERTGDTAFIEEIWSALQAATHWIERRIEASAVGLVEYRRAEETGLRNQGWKDSEDSIFHSDGSLPRGPIAVVEVQGYAFAAFQAMADLAKLRGDSASAEHWRRRAQRLREAIEKHYWMEDRRFYAIALDGDGRLCRVEGSNAGHLLFCGVPAPDRAAKVVERLDSEAFSSGWGIRTLANDQARYNPMSYHNGSIWPHDTAICAAGMARYGARQQAADVVDDLFEASHHFQMRMPELFCGFQRIHGQGPIPYPVACLPQAWAAGSLFMLLQACLGIRIDGRNPAVHIDHPILPAGIDVLEILELSVGRSTLDLHFHRVHGSIVVVPNQRSGEPIPVLSHL